MIVRSTLARVALFFPHRKAARFLPHIYNAGRALVDRRCDHHSLFLGAAGRGAMAAPSRVWMSTSSDDDNEVISNTGVNGPADPSNNTNEPATRAMFLGNVLPILADTAGVVLTGITLAFGLLYFQQDKLLYIPEMGDIFRPNGSNPPGYKSPAEYNVPFEAHMIKTSDDGNAIHSWLLLHPRSKQDNLPTIMFFHGNAG